MKANKSKYAAQFLICMVISISGSEVSAQGCVPGNGTDCEEILHVMDLGDPSVQAHMQYGDTIVLRTNGQQTFILEDVELWNNPNPILLTPTVVVTTKEDGNDKIELVWQFTVRIDDHDNGPNVQHTKLTLRRVGDQVLIDGGQHPDGEIHAGRAHLN